MKVLHLIPAAFDYFDDIRDKAMSLAEHEREFNVDAEALTLQYGGVSRQTEKKTAAITPSLGFKGLINGEQILKELEKSDLVHLHCPFLGLARDLVVWKKHHSIPLLVTYYRDVPLSNLFALFVAWYNRHYLPKIFSQADAVCTASGNIAAKTAVGRLMPAGMKDIIFIDQIEEMVRKSDIHLTVAENKIKLVKADVEALAYISIYNKLLSK